MSSSALFDADRAVSDELAALRRRRVSVAEVDADARAEVIADYLAATAAGDHGERTRLLLHAMRLDAAAPHGPRLTDELRGLSYPAAA
ncbi:hypothetical protein ACFVT5_41075 [Streptomyces sp. NPDC058001]|uniref:hypothetical protein n=1 Tax=Streptomyces sp. NPDC058001 TaxID=3346300 RepID=UPI0036E9800E